MASVIYLDSSAIVKLIVLEAGSDALRAWLEDQPRRAASAIARTEVLRAVRPEGAAAIAAARRILSAVDLIAIDDSILDVAALLRPQTLRTLDAVHLASALSIGEDLASLVTYDRRMVESATACGIPTISPA
ncbi:MAG: type II toxin-antitoxin system VapC family toxin [Chloroflexota bacterium]|nr:type II toxin-antitoxin system VapC family toxin [Chloroflexota bacterium]